jgi:hypothetical protein
LADTRQLLPSFASDDVLLAQSLVGGIPQYLNLLAARQSIALGLDELAFSPDGFFYDEFERIFVSHFASSEHYGSIIELLAKKSAGLSRAEIQDSLSLPAGGELNHSERPGDTPTRLAVMVPVRGKVVTRSFSV